jgi:hypothetical protein
MTWFRVDDMSAFHKKVVRAGNAAWGAFCRMGAHSSHYELDGFIPAEIASIIAANEETSKLVAVGFLEPVNGGYQMHDFLEWNPSAEEVQKLRKKRAKAGRQGGGKTAANRVASAQASDVASAQSNGQQRDRDRDLGILNLSEGDPGETPTDPPVEAPSETRIRRVNAAADGAFGLAVTAWADGIRSVTGKPFTLPAGGSAELSKLVGAMHSHCPDPGQRVDWSRAQGADFARSNRGKLSAHSFVDWLNTPEAQRQGAPGPATVSAPIETPAAYRARMRRADEAHAELKAASTLAPVKDLLAAVGKAKK